jgi:hypothetical protein
MIGAIAMRTDERVRGSRLKGFLMSIIYVAGACLLASGYEKLARLFCDLVRKAEDRRITREVANDVCVLSG